MANWKTRHEVPDSDDESADGDSPPPPPVSFPAQIPLLGGGTEIEGIQDEVILPASADVCHDEEDEDESQDELALPGSTVRVQSSLADITRKSDGRRGDRATKEKEIEDQREKASPGRREGLDVTVIVNPALAADQTPQASLSAAKDTSTPPSIPSSPLTDLSSSPPETWGRLSQAIQEADAGSPVATTAADILAGPLELDDMVVEEIVAADGTRRRSMRKRNAIQLNPYKVENQLYRRSIQNTGIVPVRIRDADLRSERSDDYEPDAIAGDTQDIGFNGGARDGSWQDSPGMYDFPDDNDPMAGLDALLGLPGSSSHGMGRSGEPVRMYSRKRKRRSHSSGTAQRPQGTTIALSPPPSSQSPRERKVYANTFRFPAGVTPPQLQTPAISSDVRPHHRGVASDGSSDGEEPVILRHDSIRRLPDGQISSRSESEAASSNDEADIQVARRRIRGVLPASWLRIDQQKQVESTHHHPPRKIAVTSPQRESHRGVARPLTNRRAANPNREFPIATESSDDSMSEELAITIHPQTPQSRSWDAPPLLPNSIDVDSDSMEEDFIDPMLPSASRSHKLRTHSGTNRARHIQRSTTASEYQTRISDHLRTEKRSRKLATKRTRTPKISIIDVIDQETQELPDFLRIALRTTRGRRDRGRQLPDKKLVRLGPPGAADEAQETLSRWRDRSLHYFQTTTFRYQPEGVARGPLHPVNGNVQRRSLGSRKNPASELSSTSTKLARHWKASKRQETLEQSLNRYARSQSTIEAPQRQPTHSRTKTQYARIPAAISSHVFRQDSLLPAQLESELTPTEPRISRSSLQTQRAAVVVEENPILERFFQPSQDVQSAEPGKIEKLPASAGLRTTRRLQRKRPPQQTVIETLSVPPLFTTKEQRRSSADADDPKHDVTKDSYLQGLGSHRSSFSHDFDIDPFPMGSRLGATSLPENSLVQRLMNGRPGRDLMVICSASTICFGDLEYHWAAWNEEVSVELGSVFTHVSHSLQAPDVSESSLLASVHALHDISLYIADGLRFLDAVDRRSCVDRLAMLIIECSKALQECFAERATSHIVSRQDLPIIRLSLQVLILSFQLAQLAQDDCIPLQSQTCAQNVVSDILQVVVQAIFREGISDFYQYQQALANCSGHWASRRSAIKAEGLHLAIQISRTLSIDLWKIFHDTELFSLMSNMRDVELLERKWFNLFIVLPFFDIGPSGTVDEQSKNTPALENWAFVHQLIIPVLEAYKGNSKQESILNNYCCAVLGRCLVLIGQWRWFNCEVILRAFYDFFARHNLENLPVEDVVGYPNFLTDFKITSLVLQRSDSAFHIFLKIIGQALSKMAQLYPEKRMRSIAFRLIPNHSRSLPKEDQLRQEDLDALRNHHNLLCLLYIVLPPSCRPRMGLVRDLIRVEDSHRQACHVSIRTWCDLTLFQLSTQEPLSTLELLTSWHSDILSQLLRQHGQARQEVESHDGIMSFELLNSLIAKNQRQVEVVIVDALKSLKRAIRKSSSVEATGLLITPSFESVFQLFDANVPRINTVLIEALNVVDEFLKRICHLTTNSESQDFGDWAIFDELISTEPSTSKIPDGLLKALQGLLSNCLGSNLTIDEQLVIQTISTWVSAASQQVSLGSFRWSDFMDPYGKESWFKFRQTDQKAKYTPLFFALIIEQNPSAYEEHRFIMLKTWISSVVERESRLKYQARLTNAILNCDTENPLLENLPFSRDGASGSYSISISELCSRRCSLISCVLSNMAESLFFNVYHNLDSSSSRYEYSELLKTLMKTMKDNYTALGTGLEIRGAYVEFVQAVVGFLQQYTNHIQPVDRFFTDAKNFPLPVNDPTYVVSRLKSYQLKLAEAQGAKQLVAFIQSVLERAVVDGDEAYLVGQLQLALSGAFEYGGDSRPTLRAILIKSILPAYVDAAVKTQCGWLLAAPLLRALPPVFHHLLSSMDAASLDSLGAVYAIIDTFLVTCSRSINTLLEKPTQLMQAGIVRLLTLFYETVIAALRPLDYCVQLSPCRKASARAQVQFYCSFGARAFATMQGLEANTQFGATLTVRDISLVDATLAYASMSLRTTLDKWHVRAAGNNDEYELRSLGGTRGVRTGLRSWGQELGALRKVLGRLVLEVDHLPAFEGLE